MSRGWASVESPSQRTPYDGTVISGAPWAGRFGRGLALVAATAIALGLSLAAPARADDTVKLNLVMTSLIATGTSPEDQVTVKLTLTNTGTIPAYGVVAHLWRSQDPIHDQAGLQAVADGTSTWGGWPTGTGSYLLITNSTTAFAPGATKQFKLTAKLSQLGFVTTGVAYAFGVDVVATADQSSNYNVVAKVRTFVPMPGEDTVAVTSTVLLSSTPSKLAPNVFANDNLTAELTGRLGALLTAAGDVGNSWLIDPALLDEVRDQADGYQVLDGTVTKPGAGQQVAADWLARFLKLDRSHGARTLFANPDTSGAQATQHNELLSWSRSATNAVEGVSDLPLVIVPTGSTLTAANLSYLASAGASAIIATNSGTSGALQRTSSTTPLLAVATQLTTAQPGDSTAAIASRQFALAQTVVCGSAGEVRLLTTAAEVTANAATLPSWTSQRSLGAVLAETATRRANLTAVKTARLSNEQFTELNRISDDFDAYSELVPDSTFTAQPESAHLRSVASAWITDATAGDRYADSLAKLIGRPQVSERIHLYASARFVMSARSNQFPVTVTNDSLEPIRVRVVVTSDNPQRLSVPPSDVVTVAPGQSQTVNVRPEATANGLISASAHLTTASGRRVSPDVPLSIEVTELGVVAWIIVGVSAVVLVGATAWRIRQVRRRDSQNSPDLKATNQT